MKTIIRCFIITGIWLVYSFSANAADTLRINLTYKYKIDASGQPAGYMTTKQQFITPDGIFFREINFDENTGLVSNYIYRFYREHKLFTEEFYSASDSLMYIVKHAYDAKGNEIVLTHLVPKGKELIETEKTVQSYNNNVMLSCKKYIEKKPAVLTRYKYDATGLLLSERTTCKPVANVPFKQEMKQYSYSADHKVASINITRKENSGKLQSSQEKYEYNQKGLVSSIRLLASDGSLSGEKVYRYLDSGSPSYYEEHDATGKLTFMLQYAYRKHYMEQGTQVSYYENL
jgi:hypothetical protein